MRIGRIIIIGAGPAGMMAAIRAAQLGGEVILVEKNSRSGRKLLLTGNGRCNFTNMRPLDDFISKIPGNGWFLRDAFKVFFSEDLICFFHERGVKTVVDGEKRVFPATDKSATVLKALTEQIDESGIRTIFNEKLTDIITEKRHVKGVVLSSNEKLFCEKVILATGGVTYPSTGSTGDGIKIAREAGHRVVKMRPGLVPLITVKDYSALEGLSLRNAGISIDLSGRKKKLRGKGDILFTAKGVSGPLILSCSSKAVDRLDEGKHVSVLIDMMPDFAEENVFLSINRHITLHPKKSALNMLKTFVPGRMGLFILDMREINQAKLSGQLKAEERRAIAASIKKFEIPIKSPALLEEAMITRGGVSTKDIDPRTMASRLVEGLFFAGEIIDVDGDSGGFNLQAAFSTGYLAGQSAATFPK